MILDSPLRHVNTNLPCLLDIFQLLESPDPSPYLDVCMSSDYADIFKACLSAERYDGMRTRLHNYQKNSVFKMLRRELLPDLLLDPKFSPILENEDTEKKRLNHPLLPYFQFARGFDEATNRWVYQNKNAPGRPVSAQDVSWYEDSRGGIICEDMGTGKTCECLALTLLTKRQMAHPPIEGERLPCVGTVASALKTSRARKPGRVPQLKDLAAERALLSCAESLRVMNDDKMIPADIWQQQLEPYPPYYLVNPIADSNARRTASHRNREMAMFRVYMSSSTIVVVPDNLIDQWVREKYKHVEDSCGLEILKIDDSMREIPDPPALIKYDLVLITVSRLSEEYTKIDSNIDVLWQRCRCLSLGFSKCSCEMRTEKLLFRSPLLRVHWKRLIVDEGHIMSARNTTRSLMVTYLIADRRWVCTGTPTHNLVHATSALVSGAQTIASTPSYAESDSCTTAGNDIDNSDTLHDSNEESIEDPETRRRPGLGPRESSSDFLQLGTLISKFLRVGPFAHSASMWSSLIVQPYKRNEPGASNRLRMLMQSIMVRNLPETVHSEIQLPPLYERAVELQPTRQQALTYNTIVAFFHINAILTERAGRDYFFHPENKQHLRRIVKNLFLSCFWFPISLKHISDGITNGQRALELWKQGKKPYSDKDVSTLEQSVGVLVQASDDSEWTFVAQSETVGYWVDGLPQKLTKSMFRPPSASGDNPSRIATPDQLQEIATCAKEMTTAADDDMPPRIINISPHEYEQLRSSTIPSCTSNKIAYIVDQVQRFHQSEKCIVFVNSPSEVLLVHDALGLARILHLVYANQGMSRNQRRHNIMTFSTSVVYNVIVMDVHLAAYGIDLSAASRVWFTSPIWQAARERQAIKRAHRLGQTKPVFVETLLTEGSLEEELWRRRQEISSDGSDDGTVAKDIEEDGKMRRLLTDLSFVIPGTSETLDSGRFASGLRFWPQKVQYSDRLRQKYEKWCPQSPARKVCRLRLRVVEPAESAQKTQQDSCE
ncbi:hypothetical protein LPJ53_000068 [Coemansia erecta]|uniref:Helicase C-terminal domain-containing protein n=1 Tax=Coemansia erecta TaxID=147472 RepID=A0A9W7Y8N8_9FUNG|nr:hypothetical protein LPJ53_000068 [Coemansia erecta]